MANSTMYSDRVSVYPGIYERSWTENELEKELHRKNVKVKRPQAHVQQFPGHYRIDLAIPGYDKESFFIHTDGRMLSIMGMNKKGDGTLSDHNVTETNFECFKRNIILPVEADTDFVSAEYINGMLRIYISTSNQKVEKGSNNIIVY